MGLESDDQTFVRIISGSLQCGLDLSRVMSVIVNDRDPVDFTFILETAVCSAKRFQTGFNCVCRNAKLKGNGACRQCVTDIVLARHLQFYINGRRERTVDPKCAVAFFIIGDVSGIHIIFGCETEGQCFGRKTGYKLLVVWNTAI